MAKMRTAQPKLKEIQERYKDDRAKLGTEMMALYKKEGINPAGWMFSVAAPDACFYCVLFLFKRKCGA
jgi:YidC/Oxa1 family membrane protein insertase